MDFFRLSKYPFFAFVFLLPLQTVFLLREPFINGEKWQYGTIGIYAIDILLVVVLGVVFTRWFRGFCGEDREATVSKIKQKGMDVALVLFVIWSGLSVVWSEDRALALFFLVKLLLAVGVFLWARSFDGALMKKVVFVFLVAGLIQGGIGIAQFFSQQSVDASLLGMSVHEAWQAGSSVLKIDSGRFLRAYGTFPHPNMLGGFLGVILAWGVAYSVLYGPSKKSKKSLWEERMMLLGLPIIFLGLLLTFSRTAWLGGGLGIFVLGMLLFWKKAREMVVRFSKILFVLGLAGIVFASLLQKELIPRFDVVTIGREGSVSERMLSLQDARGLIVAHPFIGVGVGNFTAEMLSQYPSRPVWSIQPAHNIFVLVLAELGIIGFALGCLFLLLFFRSVLRKSFFQQKENAIFIIALLSLLPSLLLDHWLWTSHFGLFFFFLLAGLAARTKEE